MADRPIIVLGVDPGFASFGYSIVQLFPKSEEVLSVNVIRTKKSVKKQKVLVADDNFRRARAIAAILMEVISTHMPAAIAAEGMSFPRNASAAAKVAMAWGILAAVVEDLQLPLVQGTPQQIKKTLTGKTTASKEEVRDVLLERYPGQFAAFMQSTPTGQWEHGFDSAAAVVTCLDSDVLRMARGMV